MNHHHLTEILDAHALWLADPSTGTCADLTGADPTDRPKAEKETK